jgi:glycosyltransferase involved in cell wall biosynthesis
VAPPSYALTTVIMPAFRSERTIRTAVESVLAQTEPRLELLIVDDASPIPVRETLAGLDDPRVRIVRHRRNRGSAAGRATALKLARTPYVSQLDPDDAWEPRYLASVLPRFDDPRIGLTYTNATIVGHPTGHDDYIGDASVHPMDTFPKFAEQCPVPALTATMRTDAVREVGGYARWTWAAGDYYLYARLIAAGYRFAYVNKRLARYSWPSARAGKSGEARRVERYELLVWMAFAARHPLTPGPRRQIRVRVPREARALVNGLRRRLPAS